MTQHKKGFDDALARLPENKQKLLQLIIDTKQWFDSEFRGRGEATLVLEYRKGKAHAA